jgi:hypothetical protein
MLNDAARPNHPSHQTCRWRQPVQKELPRKLAPGTHAAFVGIPVLETNRRFGYGKSPYLAPRLNALDMAAAERPW